MSKSVTLRTPLARLSFPALFEPKASDDPKKKPQYEAMFLFDKEAQQTKEFKALVEVTNQMIKEAYPKGVPRGFKNPFKKGERLQTKNGEWYSGCNEETVAINANSQFAPEVINRQKQLLTKGNGDDQVYAGCYVYATVTPAIFVHKETRSEGLKFYLGNVMKIKDGESLGGKRSAQSEFEDIEIEETAEELQEAAEQFFS